MKTKDLLIALIALVIGVALGWLMATQQAMPEKLEETIDDNTVSQHVPSDYLAAQLLDEGLTSPRQAQEEEQGLVEGTGTHFEITDEGYLNVVVDVSSPVTIALEATDQAFDMSIAASPGTKTFTVSGMSPSTTYYLYTESYHDERVVTTDAGGTLTFDLDTSAGVYVWIQTESSLTNTVKFITDDGVGGTGGDCVSIGGNWDGPSKTCTLEEDLPVGDSIQIDSSGITLDCDGYAIRKATGRVGYGVYMPEGVDGVTVKSCVISNFNRGIYSNFSTRDTFTSNIVSNTRKGIYSRNSVGSTHIENTVTDSDYGLQIWSLTTFTDSRKNTLTGNVLSDISMYGIYVVRSNSNTLIGNTLSESDRIAMYMYDADSNTITGNTLSGSGWYAIYISNADSNTITGNSISNPGYRSIYLSEGGGSNTITGNNVSGSSYIAIELFKVGSSNTITGNSISNPGAFGIYLRGQGSSNNNTISDNTISDADQAGLRFVFVDNSNVTGNTISGTPASGMTCFGCDGNLIDNNDITAGLMYGVSISGDSVSSGSGNTVTRNKIRRTSPVLADGLGGGVVLFTVNDNLVTSNDIDVTGVGVTINTPSNGNTISDNKITSTGKGIHMFFDNGNPGAGGDDNAFLNNVINSDDDGISLRGGARNLVKDNTIQMGGGAGIVVDGSTDIELSPNVIIQNPSEAIELIFLGDNTVIGNIEGPRSVVFVSGNSELTGNFENNVPGSVIVSEGAGAHFSGNLKTEDVEVHGTFSLDGNLEVSNTLVIGPGAVLNIDGNVIAYGATITNNGAMNVTGNVEQ